MRETKIVFAGILGFTIVFAPHVTFSGGVGAPLGGAPSGTGGAPSGGTTGGTTSGGTTSGGTDSTSGGTITGCLTSSLNSVLAAKAALESAQSAYNAALLAFKNSTVASAPTVSFKTADTRDFACEHATKKPISALVEDKIKTLAESTPVSGPTIVKIPICQSGSATVSATGTQLSWNCDAVTGQPAPVQTNISIPSAGIAVLAGPTEFSSVTISSVARPVGIYTNTAMKISNITTAPSSSSNQSCTSLTDATCVTSMAKVLKSSPTGSVTLGAGEKITISSTSPVALANGSIVSASPISGEVPIGAVVNANLVAPSIAIDPTIAGSNAGNLVIAGTVWGNMRTSTVNSSNSNSCDITGLDPVFIPIPTKNAACNQGDPKCAEGLGIETGGRTWVLLNATEGGAEGVLAGRGNRTPDLR